MQYTNLGRGDVGRRDPLDCDDEVEVLDCDGCGTETVKDELEESMSGKWLCEDCIMESPEELDLVCCSCGEVIDIITEEYTWTNAGDLCEDCSEREGYGPPDCPQWGGR